MVWSHVQTVEEIAVSKACDIWRTSFKNSLTLVDYLNGVFNENA